MGSTCSAKPEASTPDMPSLMESEVGAKKSPAKVEVEKVVEKEPLDNKKEEENCGLKDVGSEAATADLPSPMESKVGAEKSPAKVEVEKVVEKEPLDEEEKCGLKEAGSDQVDRLLVNTSRDITEFVSTQKKDVVTEVLKPDMAKQEESKSEANKQSEPEKQDNQLEPVNQSDLEEQPESLKHTVEAAEPMKFEEAAHPSKKSDKTVNPITDAVEVQ